jgi:hypothetical protein
MSDGQHHEPSPEPSQSREPTPENGPEEPEPIRQARAKCISFVDEYRKRQITKTMATVDITRTVTEITGISEPAVHTSGRCGFDNGSNPVKSIARCLQLAGGFSYAPN